MELSWSVPRTELATKLPSFPSEATGAVMETEKSVAPLSDTALYTHGLREPLSKLPLETVGDGAQTAGLVVDVVYTSKVLVVVATVLEVTTITVVLIPAHVETVEVSRKDDVTVVAGWNDESVKD